MLTSVSASSKQVVDQTSELKSVGPTTTQPPKPVQPNNSSELILSDQAKKLLAAKTVVSHPLAVAAVSPNQQVDKVAFVAYQAQQRKNSLDIYTSHSPSNLNSQSTPVKPLAIAAISDNPQVDKLALSAYAVRSAQQQLAAYKRIGGAFQ